MNGYDSRTIKKAEHRRIDAFELWCWRSLLRVPWTARRSNQSILKEINSIFIGRTGVEKLKLQYLCKAPVLMQKADSLEKTLMLERLSAGEGEDRGRDGWMILLTQ